MTETYGSNLKYLLSSVSIIRTEIRHPLECKRYKFMCTCTSYKFISFYPTINPYTDNKYVKFLAKSTPVLWFLHPSVYKGPCEGKDLINWRHNGMKTVMGCSCLYHADRQKVCDFLLIVIFTINLM